MEEINNPYLQQNEALKTSDLVLASYLRAKGFPVTDTVRSGKLVYFCFDWSEEVENLIKQYSLNPTKEMQLVKDSHSERESLFRLIRETPEGGSHYDRY